MLSMGVKVGMEARGPENCARSQVGRGAGKERNAGTPARGRDFEVRDPPGSYVGGEDRGPKRRSPVGWNSVWALAGTGGTE